MKKVVETYFVDIESMDPEGLYEQVEYSVCGVYEELDGYTGVDNPLHHAVLKLAII